MLGSLPKYSARTAEAEQGIVRTRRLVIEFRSRATHLGLEYLTIVPNKLARLHSQAHSQANVRFITQARKDNFVFPAFSGPIF